MLPTFHINRWLLPLAWLYGGVMEIRNWLFDKGYFKTVSFEEQVPVICVGNISAGGTAKTPHVEYLVQLLQSEGIGPVAVLSRGYKRRSNGFQLAEPASTVAQLGDEPYQIYRKFSNAIVAVCESRAKGIRELLALPTPPAVIILDDAMQHRWLSPGFTICLTSYSRILYKDCLLPAGRLREPAANIRRADMVIVTKCPASLRKEDQTEITGNLPTSIEQPIYFTQFKYEQLVNLATLEPQAVDPRCNVLMVCGIADPSSMEEVIQTHYRLLDKLIFPDHHNFSAKDIREIRHRMENIDNDGLNPNTGLKPVVITTEKDAMRLMRHRAVDDELKARIFFLPAHVAFISKKHEQNFKNRILNYVRKNQKHC